MGRAFIIGLAAGLASLTEVAAAQEVTVDASRLNRLAAELSAGEWRGHNRADLRSRLLVEPNNRPGSVRLHVWGERGHPLNGVALELSPNATGERLQSARGNVRVRRQFDDCVQVAGEVQPVESHPGLVHVNEILCPSSTAVWSHRERWLGRWQTALGTLEIERGRGGVLRGWFSRPDAGGNTQRYRRVSFGEVISDTLLGGWSNMTDEAGRGVEIRLGADGGINGRIWLGDDTPTTFTGRRIGPEPSAPAPSSPPPASPPPPPPPSPTPPPSSPDSGPPAQTPADPAGFSRLGPFEVRFDRLERARGSVIVRAVVTIRNVGQQLQHLPSGTFRAILTDADGVGQERNQLWRGSGEPAQLFNGTPTLQPGGELTVRFTFNPDNRDLDSLVLMRGQEQVEFDMAGR